MTTGEKQASGTGELATRRTDGIEATGAVEPGDGIEIGGPTESSTGVTGRPEVLDGPFSTRQLLRIDEALRAADQGTGLVFSVYVGGLADPVREHAEKLHAQLADPARSVLIAVCPNQRVLEVVTGSEARKRIPDRAAKLAALSMVAAFGGGDLAGGVVAGLDQLATHAGKAA